MMNIDTVIFLGAGASKAEGAPLQGELFKEYFDSAEFKESYDEMDRELATFFLMMFGIDLDQSPIPSITFPTFEEVLGLTDLAILRKESFRNFEIENRATNSGRLRFIAQYLVFMVARLLHSKLGERASVHRRLVQRLHAAGELRKTAFVSTNYDILIDNALTEMWPEGVHLDYGIEFRNFERPGDWARPEPDKRVYLLKPHGSLNWLLCPVCNSLEITPKEKGVVTRLISDFRRASCEYCGGVYVPLIVPPTFYKDMTNVFLGNIWREMEDAFRSARRVIFCGYSLPDADMHIKYLLKRGQTNRRNPLGTDFVVVNNHAGKSDGVCDDERNRFARFLGHKVRYLELSFEQFSENPVSLLSDVGVGH